MFQDDALSTPTLKRAWFIQKYKVMISILHICNFEVFGSFDQFSANQQMLLVGLTLDQEINWERAFISHLLADRKVFFRENRIKLGKKVLSIILEALKG